MRYAMIFRISSLLESPTVKSLAAVDLTGVFRIQCQFAEPSLTLGGKLAQYADRQSPAPCFHITSTPTRSGPARSSFFPCASISRASGWS